LRQGATAVAREARQFAEESVDHPPDATVRAWHGVDDDNAPIEPVRTYLDEVGGTLVEVDGDHLGTLLDRRREVFDWATE
ncbi:alpha/beta hydrolase, partial [Halorubrum pallidum]